MTFTVENLVPDGKFRPFAQASEGTSQLEIAFASDRRTITIRRKGADADGADQIVVPTEAWSTFIEDVANGNFRLTD